MMENRYKVLAARTQEAVDERQADVEQFFDTKKEAQAFAKRSLTDEYMRSGEMSEPLTFAAVFDTKKGERTDEYWRTEE